MPSLESLPDELLTEIFKWHLISDHCVMRYDRSWRLTSPFRQLRQFSNFRFHLQVMLLNKRLGAIARAVFGRNEFILTSFANFEELCAFSTAIPIIRIPSATSLESQCFLLHLECGPRRPSEEPARAVIAAKDFDRWARLHTLQFVTDSDMRKENPLPVETMDLSMNGFPSGAHQSCIEKLLSGLRHFRNGRKTPRLRVDRAGQAYLAEVKKSLTSSKDQISGSEVLENIESSVETAEVLLAQHDYEASLAELIIAYTSMTACFGYD